MPNVNGVRGEFVAMIGDDEYVLVADFRSLAQLEAGLGRSVLVFARNFIENQDLSIKDAVLLFDTLMKAPERPARKPTPEQLGNMILAAGLIGTVAPVIVALMERISGAPRPSEDEVAGN